MERILCIVDKMDTGGAETFLMKIYRTVNREKIQFDFITCIDEKGFYDEEIKSLGGKIFHMPHVRTHPIKSFYCLYRCVKNNNYKNVLLTSAWSLYSVLLLVAKVGGAQKCGIRATNTRTGRGFVGEIIHVIFRPLVNLLTDVKIAPSKLAAQFMFGKNIMDVHIIKNGIKIDTFCFDKLKRKHIREKMGIDEPLIGHIGRMAVQKNHMFLIRTFYEYRRHHKAKLILVGEGSLKEKVKQEVERLGISDDVIFAGVRSDVPELLMAMDVFVFPSFWEGLPNSVIEAQATGLPCLISDRITNECKITKLVQFEKLDDPKKWAAEINKKLQEFREREKFSSVVKENRYDICDSTDALLRCFFDDDLLIW